MIQQSVLLNLRDSEQNRLAKKLEENKPFRIKLKPRHGRNGFINISLTSSDQEKIAMGKQISLKPEQFEIKEGGALPALLIPGVIAGLKALGLVGGVATGVSSVVSAVNQKKHQNKMLEEQKKINENIEKAIKGEGFVRRNIGKGYVRRGEEDKKYNT